MRESVLQPIHDSAGAEFTEVGGWKVPAHYGDVASEYGALRNGVALFDLSARGKLRVTGADRARFLHGMVTNRVEGLEDGESRYAALTDARGNTLADLWVHNRGEAFLLETEPGLQEKVAASLDRYLIADDVVIKDVTTDSALIGVRGPKAQALIRECLQIPNSGLPQGRRVLGSYGATEVELTVGSPLDGAGFSLWVELGVAVRLWTALHEAGAQPVGFEALEIVRIESGVPRYGIDVDEQVIPLEAGLDRAVDFEKGCFIGQEAIAKMHRLGKPRRYLVGLVINGDAIPRSGTAILEGEKEIGRITSCVKSRALNRTIALASVRRGFEAPGKVLFLDGGAQAEVAALPFRPVAAPA